MLFKPIEIARELNISTSLLRHYEKSCYFPYPREATVVIGFIRKKVFTIFGQLEQQRSLMAIT
ncbi:hypothetical protein GQR36_21815 [Enterococcus termitis]